MRRADGFFQQMTLMDAISTAEQLHLFMQHADRVFMGGMAQAVNVIHSLFFTRAADAALVKTPAFYVFKMFVPHHSSGAKWAPNTLASENITGNGATFPGAVGGQRAWTLLGTSTSAWRTSIWSTPTRSRSP